VKIIYKTGDVTEASEKIIAHGCNAQGVMGSGVAKAIRTKFPGCFEAYQQHIKDGYLLGTTCVFVANYSPLLLDELNEKIIFNMITQLYYGNDGQRYVDYEAVRSCMKNLNKRAGHFTKYPHEVAMPAIGAGLGNGDWDILSSIIEEECKDIQPVVYIL
jgi:O-acetyl-ADP-ribose deacetylase (regulator of RNase III)